MASGLNTQGFSLDNITLKDILLFIWDHKISIFVVTVLFMAGTIFIALTAQVKYISTSKLITKSSSSNSNEFSQMAALAGISMASSNSNDVSKYLPEKIKDGPI
jgi:uncharacterized protein involved in exopolysaccharide biosynthesis